MKDHVWHSIEVEEVLRTVSSHRSGLSADEAQSRLAKYGENELKAKKKTHPVIFFLQQFLSPLIYVLLAAAIVSLVTDHLIDAIVIFVVLLLNATIGFMQEQRAEKAMEALLQMAAPRAKVRRDNKMKHVPTSQIVPGDIILLEPGDRVAADARLIESSNLKINEAMLTGESMPVEKHTHVVDEHAAVADRKNMVYMGTIVTYGRATAVVVSTGMQTEIGKIATALEEIKKEKTPLQRSIQKLSQYIIFAVIGALALLVTVGIIRGLDWIETFFLAVAAAVSAIPEGLPAIVTVVLAVGMQIMARRNAIIRRLSAVETLGSATVICSDKTGTLTLNEMTVRRLYVGGRVLRVTGDGYQPEGDFIVDDKPYDYKSDELLKLLLRIGVLCNDALLSCEKGFCEIYGDPTEGALVVAAAKAGMVKEEMETAYPRIDEIPFISEKQYMATLHPDKSGKSVIYVKGSLERVLEYSGYIATDQGILPLTDKLKDKIIEVNDEFAQSALRVIAVACKEIDSESKEITEDLIKSELTFVGLFGMEDPPRPEAIEAVKLCQQAGIKVVMITGDNKMTAVSIARQLNLTPGDAVTGVELEKMSDEELERKIDNISVFARIEPLHKLRIVNAFKNRGHTVAMTGDGVNDAPALRSANIGVAMGITGTDVAKEASEMVLADDNFASVVAAVEEGRAIFNRLRYVIFYLLSTNFGELLALLLCVGIIGKAPLLALQIIWINLVTDTTAGIPLGMEPKHGDELKQPPRHPKVGLLYPGLLLRVMYMSALMALGVFFIFDWAQSHMEVEKARTLVFCTVAVFEWFKAFIARSDDQSVFKVGFLRNKWLLRTVSLAILLQIFVVYTPFMQIAFGTVPIGLELWGIALAAGCALFVIEELRKVLLPNLFNLGKWRPIGNRTR